VNEQDIRKAVRERYAERVKQGSSCCTPANSCECSTSQEVVSEAIGYTEKQLQAVPEGANLGLGCGNPTALASLKEGDVVLDLGSGAGIDCFLAADAVGESGHVIGVDMTAEMIEKARENAGQGDYHNVEFRLGEIENLPIADSSVDVVISNCVINLSPDKARVFEETYRTLRPGGRLMVSDIVLLKPLPDVIRSSVEAYVGCIAGAAMKQDYLASIENAGFQQVEVLSEVSAKAAFSGTVVDTAAEKTGISPGTLEQVAETVVSISVRAVKPVGEQ
jgi:ubiquinone/menaquinone biosynthesis C-methylase UbiE